MKFAGEGIKPKASDEPGMEKSFISLFMITPVSGTMRRLPKIRLMVVVREMDMPEWSAVTMCDVPSLR
jgi:hypothetical protein